MSAPDLPAYTQPTFEYSKSPNSTFQYGQKVGSTPEGKEWLEGEKDGWKVIETETEDPAKLYTLMTSAITPRPVAFVSSISETGIENLALFSWFNMVTHSPPLVSISVRTLDGSLKDTSHNIKATKQFTVSIISAPWVDNANVCCLDAPPEISEWPISGLTQEPSVLVKPARVKEAAFSMECELYQEIDIPHQVTGVPTTTLILGLVKYIHVRKDMLTERGTVDPNKLKAVGRLGDISYGTLGGGFRIPRPAWQVEGEKIKELLKNSETVPAADL